MTIEIVPYIQPSIFNTEDVDTIYARMIDITLSNGKKIKDCIDTSEASFFYDSAYPTAVEKAQLVQQILNQIVKNGFAQYAEEAFLDLHATLNGLVRLPALPSYAILTVIGTPGVIIPLAFRFSSVASFTQVAVEYETLASYTIPIGGTLASIQVKSVLTGELTNIPANGISLMSVPLAGITSINNPLPAAGGADIETDEALQIRILEKAASTPGGGSKDDYENWAEEVDGVGRAYCIPEWLGVSTGTVKILVLDTNYLPAIAALVAAVQAYIYPTTGTGKAPVGAIVTVVAPTPIIINIDFTVWLDPKTAKLADVLTAFAVDVQDYFYESKDIGLVYYKEISKTLLLIQGVLNHTILTVSISDTIDTYTPPGGGNAFVKLVSGCLDIALNDVITIDGSDYTIHDYVTATKTAEILSGPGSITSTAVIITIDTAMNDFTIDKDQYPVIGNITGAETP